ncbi:MAG: NADH-quinone oxidoreductase subunit C [Myxococcota bacterium]|jgi:NADH-quinone oxidoreductase subunit C
MSEVNTPAAPSAAPADPPPSPLQGAAAVLPGKPVEEMQAALAAASPHAAERKAENAAKQAERAATLATLFKTIAGVDYTTADGGPLVPREKHFALAKALKDAGFTFYVTVVATHFLAQKTKTGDEPERFEVATVLRSVGAGSTQVAWRVALGPGEEVDSLVPLFAGADWQEREQYDLVGVRFAGHPDLRRLMMPDEWEGHPLRRDYAIDTRCAPWR